MAKKVFENEAGKMEVLCYMPGRKPDKGFDSFFVVNLIASFEGNDNFGQDGDRITFIQLVRDTFYGQKISEKERLGKEAPKYYTWKLNGEAVFTEGDISEKEELDWTIDQVRTGGNKDFRYTESRTREDEPMSSMEEKVERLLAMSDEELIKNKFFDLEKVKKEERRAYIEAHMFSDEDTLPYIAFSAEKKGGKWEKARISDTPCVPCDSRKQYSGGQEFQIAVLHESSSGEKKIIGTLFWGRIFNEESKSIDLLELKFQDGSTAEMGRAITEWDARSDYMPINRLA